MVLFRALQGVGGAFIVPLAQATLFDINPREKHGQAMALFGGGVMIGPILGPVLGGWLTDNYNWRWVFLVNLPVGVICALLMAALHAADRDASSASSTCSASPCSRSRSARLQLFLDRGEQNDWFDSWEIIVEAGVAIAAGWMFVVHIVTAKHPLFERGDVRRPQFRDRPGVHGGHRRAAARRPRAAAAAAPEPLRLFGASVGLPDRAARRRHPDLDAARRPAGRQDRFAAAGRDRRRADGRLAVDDDRLRDRPAVAPGDRQRRRPGARPRPDLRAAAEPGFRDAGAAACGPPAAALLNLAAQHRRLGRHLGRQRAAGADDPGRARRHRAATSPQQTIPTADPTSCRPSPRSPGRRRSP